MSPIPSGEKHRVSTSSIKMGRQNVTKNGKMVERDYANIVEKFQNYLPCRFKDINVESTKFPILYDEWRK